jgi:hypothetical protein
VAELITKMISVAKKINDSYQESIECGLASNRIPKKDLERNLQVAKDDLARRNNDPPGGATDRDKMSCTGCGMNNHTRPKCSLTAHPDYNKSEGPWASSRSGVKYTAAGKNRLTFGKDVTGAPNGMTPTPLGGGKSDKKSYQISYT